jgi:hypothetical protein
LIKARLTGTVTTNATTSEPTRLAQNSRSVSPAFIAPGTASTTALSMTSMVAIDNVSAASATPNACLGDTPDRRTGVRVSE